jgi:hypothetical protein
MAEKKDVWTRNQEYGGVGEPLDVEKIEVEESAEGFEGFEADEEVDVEKLLADDHEKMEGGK